MTTSEVLERDDDGNPTVVVVTVTPTRSTPDQDDLREQAIRGQAVAESLAIA